MDWAQVSAIIVAAGVFGGIVNLALQGGGVRETAGAHKDLFARFHILVDRPGVERHSGAG